MVRKVEAEVRREELVEESQLFESERGRWLHDDAPSGFEEGQSALRDERYGVGGQLRQRRQVLRP